MGRGIDDLLRDYDVNEVHRRVYPAAAADVREALESLRAEDLPLTRRLMAVRTLPARLLGRRRDPDDGPLLDRLTDAGFARLVDTPNDAAFAVIGKFWRPDGGRRDAVRDAAEFRAFDEPGWAKAVMSFELTEVEGGTELLTETRVWPTSAGAWRAFRLYWLVVGAGSKLIRREILDAVGRRVERAPQR
jgi:hypothetical protein